MYRIHAQPSNTVLFDAKLPDASPPTHNSPMLSPPTPSPPTPSPPTPKQTPADPDTPLPGCWR